MSLQEQRSSRIKQVIETLKGVKNINDYDVDKLVAMGCVDWSCSRRTMLEYIKIATDYLR